jgi:thymidylate synthase (FAD)
MTEIKIVQPKVYLRKVYASDDDVIEAMLVSTLGDDVRAIWEQEGKGGIDSRIRFLMKNRHGTPFEHTYFQFFVKAPIAVFREFHRHRIGWSYNEESGRYKQLKPEFYIPPPERPLIQTGKPGHYIMEPGSDQMHLDLAANMANQFQRAYDVYEEMLEMGVAREVARGVLPVYIMSSMYATCNARSLMAFLSLRTEEPEAAFPSKPMWEIDRLVAREMEAAFSAYMPLTYQAFCDFGRVAP